MINKKPVYDDKEHIGIISLGCVRNTVDSEKILNDAKAGGAIICPLEKASTVLVNTCAFTKDAKQESIDVILDLVEQKRRGRIKKIIVFGCLVERYLSELKENFKEVDGFYGVTDFKENFKKGELLTPVHYAYIKISEGCANNCSYCAIPSIKGPLRSRKQEHILKEVEELSKKGTKELIIVGQDITLYGNDFSDSGDGLVGLLKKILKKSSSPWIRLLYLNPRRINKALLDLMAGENRILPYIDMPLQHINDRILKLMNRKIGRKEIISVLDEVRYRLPSVSLRTTFIVGFPTETAAEFKELCDFVKSARFEKMGAFKYSREEGTPAFSLKGQLSQKIKDRRYGILMSIQKAISSSLLKAKIGQTVDVMVDEKTGSRTQYLGRTVWDAPEVDGVFFLRSKNRLCAGDIVKARVIDALEYDLVGEVSEI